MSLLTDDDGCHFLHIHNELRKLLIYSQLSKAALSRCLTVLETQSDIIETANWRYITVRWLTEYIHCDASVHRTCILHFVRLQTDEGFLTPVWVLVIDVIATAYWHCAHYFDSNMLVFIMLHLSCDSEREHCCKWQVKESYSWSISHSYQHIVRVVEKIHIPTSLFWTYQLCCAKRL